MRSRLNAGVALPVSAALLRLTNRKGALKRISRARANSCRARRRTAIVAGVLGAYTAHRRVAGLSERAAADSARRGTDTRRAGSPGGGVRGSESAGAGRAVLARGFSGRRHRRAGCKPRRREGAFASATRAVALPGGAFRVAAGWRRHDRGQLHRNGSDRSGETYVLEDRELPLLVFRYLGLLRPGPPVTVEGIAVRASACGSAAGETGDGPQRREGGS